MSKKTLKDCKNETEASDVMLRNLLLWPIWPYLPMKKQGNPGCFCAWAGDYKNDNEPRTEINLYEANVFHLPKTVEKFKATKKHTYPTIEALLADGWIVD